MPGGTAADTRDFRRPVHLESQTPPRRLNWLRQEIALAERFSMAPQTGNQIPPKAQWCNNTLKSGGGYSAYRPVFVPNTVDLFGRGWQQ